MALKITSVKAVVTLCLMGTINKTVVVPMLRVRCTNAVGLPGDGWPEYVQCLPPIGSLMDNKKYPRRAYVRGYTFYCDGLIEIELTDRNPVR